MKTLSAIAISFALATLILGCDSATPADETLETATLALIDGSPEAIGLLAFLNAPTTTVDVLDYDVPLNRRAARNLIHHRDGYDGLSGTYDDNLFDTISEVDDVRWVGEAAMASLTYFAHSQSWVPQGDEVLGMWDGVVFTADEAEATLALVNGAELAMLDDALGLDRRAANAIVNAQPIASVADLAGLYYVGTSALSALKEAAMIPPTPSLDVRFARDLAEHIDSWYAVHGDEAIAEGGRTKQAAIAAISSEHVILVTDLSAVPVDLQTESNVVVHPDVIFEASSVMWFGVYDAESGDLLEVGRF